MEGPLHRVIEEPGARTLLTHEEQNRLKADNVAHRAEIIRLQNFIITAAAGYERMIVKRCTEIAMLKSELTRAREREASFHRAINRRAQFRVDD
jgi:hypothetical protein